jgi:hypothetical protein
MTTISADDGVDDSGLLEWMRAKGLPITRETYIAQGWGASPPDPWTGDHEATLPLHLRDWTKCEPDEQPGD